MPPPLPCSSPRASRHQQECPPLTCPLPPTPPGHRAADVPEGQRRAVPAEEAGAGADGGAAAQGGRGTQGGAGGGVCGGGGVGGHLRAELELGEGVCVHSTVGY